MKKIQASTIEVSLAPPPVSYETDEDSAGEEDEGPKTIEKLNGAQLRAEDKLVLRQESEELLRVGDESTSSAPPQQSKTPDGPQRKKQRVVNTEKWGIDVSIQNAWLLHRKSCKSTNVPTLDLLDFRRAIAQVLMTKYATPRIRSGVVRSVSVVSGRVSSDAKTNNSALDTHLGAATKEDSLWSMPFAHNH
ncbi:hypothetical protein M8J77_014131 [Diaphorina citri]|nr:hypothetical protein M8J77_014131 [Diaphorina citri]